MKAIILTCNMGQGHNSAAKAIYEAMQRRNIESEIVDALSFGGKHTSRLVSSSYVNITVKAPRAFGFLYKAGNCISSDKRKSPIYYVNKLYADNLYEYIIKNEFDIIVTTHLFPGEALTYLKRKYNLTTKCYGVVTDYTCIPFWEELDMDIHFTPHADLNDVYIGKGIPQEKIVPLGIPVSNRFAKKLEKNQARDCIGIPQDCKMFLIMTGSMGFGNILNIVTELLRRSDQNVRIVILVGRNKKLKNELIFNYPGDKRVVPVPFTDEVPIYMDACDVLLTKPGGLSSTEAAVKNVPIVHTMPIPGCETINALFFSQHGISIMATTQEEAVEGALRLSESERERQAMLNAQQSVINSHAADDICSYIAKIMCAEM